MFCRVPFKCSTDPMQKLTNDDVTSPRSRGSRAPRAFSKNERSPYSSSRPIYEQTTDKQFQMVQNRFALPSEVSVDHFLWIPFYI